MRCSSGSRFCTAATEERRSSPPPHAAAARRAVGRLQFGPPPADESLRADGSAHDFQEVIMTSRAIALTLMAAVLLLAVPAAQAQLEELARTTPQERATFQTDFMTSRLGLSPEEARTVGALNLKYAERVEPVIKGSEGPFMKVRQMREIDEAKEAEL